MGLVTSPTIRSRSVAKQSLKPVIVTPGEWIYQELADSKNTATDLDGEWQDVVINGTTVYQTVREVPITGSSECIISYRGMIVPADLKMYILLSYDDTNYHPIATSTGAALQFVQFTAGTKVGFVGNAGTSAVGFRPIPILGKRLRLAISTPLITSDPTTVGVLLR